MIELPIATADVACNASTYLLVGSVNGGIICTAGLNGNAKPIIPATNNPIAKSIPCWLTIKQLISYYLLNSMSLHLTERKSANNLIELGLVI